MGNAFGGWVEPGIDKKDGTTLISLNINHMRDAHDIIGERPAQAFTPVVLQPMASASTCCCCPCCFVAIPQGMGAIVTKFGAVVDGDNPEDKTWSPGCHYFSPLYSVDKLVSKQLIIFDTPVKACKTKDVITVNMNVMIQFEIVNAHDFVYNIGPEKFDDLLRASQDECLRKLANETLVENIYDLSGHHQQTEQIVADLNAKFTDRYGVKVHHFTIKSVVIPPTQTLDMAGEAEEKTLFESKTAMDHAKQALDKLKLNNEEGKQKLREECDNKRMAEEEDAKVKQNQATKTTAEVVADTQKKIQELETSRDNEVKQITTSAELEVSKLSSQIMAMEREMMSKTQADCAKLRNEADAYSAQKSAEVTIVEAEKMANGHTAIAEAEGFASAAFAARRAHEAEMKRLDILQEVTTKPQQQIYTSQENTCGMSADNQAVTAVAQQGLEALRAKLAEVTATSLGKLQQAAPRQSMMR